MESEVTFVSAETLISSIQEDFAAFDANNQLDPGRWYTWIKKIVSDLGLACFEPKHALVWLKDYQGEIPCDFYILDSAFLIHDKDHGIDTGSCPSNIVHYQGRSIIWDDTQTACATLPPNGCANCDFLSCSSELSNQITVREYVKGLPYTYQVPHLFPLHVNDRLSKAWCLPHSICFGSRAKHEVSINNGMLYTNFCDGIVLLNYYAYPYDENGLPKIPNQPKIQLAIEQYVKWKIMELLWSNGDCGDCQNKMMYWKNEFETSYSDCEYWVKLASFNTMVDMVKNVRKRLTWSHLTIK